jgi:hypothetical protein
MKKSDESKLHVAEMRMVIGMYGVMMMGKIRNEYLRESLEQAANTEKNKGNYLTWYGQIDLSKDG